MTDEKEGWPLLHSALPKAALKPLSEKVYGVAGLTDVNEAYLIQRLFASKLTWDWRIEKMEYLGHEDREVRDKSYTNRYYLASVLGVLTIDGKQFHGAGASDNRKIDAAFKGASTVAFKSACKMAALTIELFKDGRAMDFIYEDRQGNVIREDGEIPRNQASAATQAALREAEAATPPQSPPSQGVPGEGTSPVPPAAEVKSGAGDMVATPPAPQSSGPRAKRHNVVKAPTAPQGAPSAAATVPASPAAASAPPVSLVDPALDGKAEYLDSLRQQAREVAAQLQHVTVKWRNAVKNREEIALGRLAPDPEVPERPNPGADAALNAYLKQFYGDDSLTLADIDEDRLASEDVKVGLIASLEHARKSVAKRLKDGK